MIQNALIMCDKNNKFLFEVLPDYFPQGGLTDIELHLWTKYHERKKDMNG